MKVFTGKVVSTKMQKTATVAVGRVLTHPIYKKKIKRIKKYHVHDEFGAKVGQTVKFIPCRPISKTKRWKIISADSADQKKISRKKEKNVKTKKSKSSSTSKTSKRSAQSK